MINTSISALVFLKTMCSSLDFLSNSSQFSKVMATAVFSKLTQFSEETNLTYLLPRTDLSAEEFKIKLVDMMRISAVQSTESMDMDLPKTSQKTPSEP
jgi:hypothetical protein